MLARALASSAPGLHHYKPWYFQFFLSSVRERRLKIHARSSRDGQVESDLVLTAGGIGPDGSVGISSRSTCLRPSQPIQERRREIDGEANGRSMELVGGNQVLPPARWFQRQPRDGHGSSSDAHQEQRSLSSLRRKSAPCGPARPSIFSRLWLPAQCQRRCPHRYTSPR